MKYLRRTWHYARRRGLVGLMVTMVVVLGFRSAVADWYDVPTGSMVPTIVAGDRIFVNKLSYDLRVPFTDVTVASWSDPARGDIVICSSPADGTRLVKRVVAVPGDVVAMRGGNLWLNGVELDREPDPELGVGLGDAAAGLSFLREDLDGHEHAVAADSGRQARRDFGPVIVPPDSYFMMGDNRDHSADSRYWGFLPRAAVQGRVLGVAFSLDREHLWRPRWERSGRRLI